MSSPRRLRHLSGLVLTVASIVSAPPARGASAGELAAMADEVRRAETAFAQTMTDRDFAAFNGFLSDEAIFSVGTRVSRGKAAVAAAWKGYFDGPQAPFSWRPDFVEVVESGTLAISSGPVIAPNGERVGTFISTWRKEKAGWRIVLDRGCPPCEPPPTTPAPAATNPH
jgi:ketosteroid isomerase-like protein